MPGSDKGNRKKGRVIWKRNNSIHNWHISRVFKILNTDREWLKYLLLRHYSRTVKSSIFSNFSSFFFFSGYSDCVKEYLVVWKTFDDANSTLPLPPMTSRKTVFHQTRTKDTLHSALVCYCNKEVLSWKIHVSHCSPLQCRGAILSGTTISSKQPLSPICKGMNCASPMGLILIVYRHCNWYAVRTQWCKLYRNPL